MVNWRRVAFWVALFCGVYFAPTEGAENPVSLKVTPKIQIAPIGKRGYVKAMWKIQLDERNLYYSFSYASPTGGDEGSTLKKMDEYSTIHYERVIELPAGQYVFQACVVRDEGKPKTYCASDEAEVR